jgi:GNAT superfamily N-acetyltransferase
MKIRPARIETDLPDIVRIINPYETNPLNVDQVRSFFEYNPTGRIQTRLVAVNENDTVAGYSGFVHEASAPDRHFIVWVVVDPSFRCRGIGATLWDATLDSLQEQGAIRLKADVHDNDPIGLGFAERRGFTIHHHDFRSILDLATFDETPYLPGMAVLKAQGIRFGSLADFPDTPESRRKLYDLNTPVDPNVVGNDLSYPEFEHFVFEAPWFRREGQLLAVDGDSWVGMAAVSLDPDNQTAYNAYTGVLPAYQGRKIGQALKILAIRYARQHGSTRIATDNNSLNAPILAINQKMGYQPQPGKYWLVCQLEGM